MTDLAEWYDEHAAAAAARLTSVIPRIEAAVTDAVFVKGRVKTRASYIEKATRKAYAEPTTQIQDLAGVRIVVPRQHLVQDAQRVVESLASTDGWTVLSVQHRGSEVENVGVPGYQAVHIVVTTDAADPCSTVEVQVMTTLQNAWAVLQHDLVYKGSDDPLHLRRATTLAGLLELAEQEFENLRLAMSGGLQELPPVLTTPRDAETLVTAIWPGSELSASHGKQWAATLFEVITDLGLTDRDRLLDILGDADARARTITRIRVWRPWMNAYLVTDFLLRLHVPDYFERRADRRATNDRAARRGFQSELEEFRRHGS